MEGQRFQDAARNAARSAYDAAKRLLGIGSPSKVTEEKIGKPFAQGIAQGIEKELAAMRQGVSGGLSGLVGGMAAQPAAAGAAEINITVNMNAGGSYDDGRAVGRGVNDELRARGLR